MLVSYRNKPASRFPAEPLFHIWLSSSSPPRLDRELHLLAVPYSDLSVPSRGPAGRKKGTRVSVCWAIDDFLSAVSASRNTNSQGNRATEVAAAFRRNRYAIDQQFFFMEKTYTRPTTLPCRLLHSSRVYAYVGQQPHPEGRNRADGNISNGASMSCISV